ncbi:MAG: hypothetical protein ACPG5B_05175 [Chitinophagales bacterium]
MKIHKKPNLLNSFLLVYFYELEKQLNASLDNKLQNIKFQSAEANTDEYLKKYFKQYISQNNNIKSSYLKQLNIKIDSESYTINVANLHKYKIVNVLLPKEINDEQKQHIANSKRSIYTNPDLYLEITDGNCTYFEAVELKSTKNNNIPGSSVQQVTPFEWVIFVKRTKNNVSVATGYYLNSITNKLPFPDRSPRPQISYKTLENWNKKYRKVNDQILSVENITELNQKKIILLNDWQDFLAKDWLRIVQAKSTKNNEKWFNNALRKFAVKFLDYTENLTEPEKKALKENLKKLIR